MDDPGQLNPLTGEHAPDHSAKGAFAAWLADYGVVPAPSTEGSTPAEDKQTHSSTETRPTYADPFRQPVSFTVTIGPAATGFTTKH